MSQEVFIVDGNRTPFLKARGQRGPFSAADLAVQAARSLLVRQPFTPNDFDEVITGCVMPSPDEANISRIIALRLGCGDDMPAWTVQRNCASGLQAIDSAAQRIHQGYADLVLAGGTEAMSHAPVMLNAAMTNWLARFSMAKNLVAKCAVLGQLRPKHFAPVIALLRGLRDPIVGLSMGQTAEKLAYLFDISREQMDAFAVQSHQRLAAAIEKNHLDEITPIYDNSGKIYAQDDGLRADSSLETLARLKPFFDKQYGYVTAGNSSQITDGAAFLILASKAAVERYQLPVRAKIITTQWSALSPTVMGLGPVHAIHRVLETQKLTLSDIDYWEINEAFAAQVLACLRAFDDPAYCREHFNRDTPLGTLPQERLNVDGGAIATGHPVGASGARVLLHLVNTLEREKAQRGIASLCIGGGQGGAMLIERVGG